jgi:cytochrome c peroxidase
VDEKPGFRTSFKKKKNKIAMKIRVLPTTFALLAAALTSTLQGADSAPKGNAAVGKAFFKTDFPNVHGNGRSCATCHIPEEAFQLSPQHVEARYQALQQRRLIDPTADDPLFRSIDANDGARDFSNLRQHALVRVIIQLPTDSNGQKLVWPLDDPDATFVSVWRATPTILNTAFTAPYQMDGRQPTLQSQALSALIGHSEITTLPKSRFLDDVAAFQSTQFSSPAVQRLSTALATGQALPPTDPPLNDLEHQGKVLFEHNCAVCHGGPTQTRKIDVLPPAVQDIHISKPLPPFAEDLPFAPSPLPARLWAFRVAGQVDPLVLPSTDPGKALISGSPDEFNFFDMPTLYGISKTAPYFHDNSAPTLEAVLRHYQLEFEAVRRVIPDFLPWPERPDPITDDQLAPMLAYLRKL